MGIDIAEAYRALESSEFLPYFQPQVQLRSGQLTGFEVLARWNHATKGIILPDDFIPFAEQDGWIDALTHQILDRAFRSALQLPGSLQLSINISPTQFRDRSLAKQFEEVSGLTGFPLARVMVEITESALTEDLAQARLIAGELKELGCKLTLDDFGTGYSSLRHLQSLPFDELKVDKSFVSSMVQKRDSRKIVAAVVGLGQSLGLTTVAEGVEACEQAEMLLWLGCDIGQGWLFGRPEPAESLPAVLSAPREKSATSIAFPWKNLSMGGMEGLPAQKLAQLQAVYDGAQVGLGFLDRDLRFVNLNKRLADFAQRPVEEHVGRTVQEMVPDIFPRFESYLHRALKGESISGLEINVPATETSSARTSLVSYQPARDEAGEVVGVSVAVLDFTARKKAEESLHQYERVVEGLEEMIVVVDRDYRYVLANHSFLANRATTKEQLLGSLVSDFVGNEVFETLVKGKLDDCFVGSVVKYEMKSQFPALGERDLLVTYIPIQVSGGVTGAACVLRDLTDMKKAERSLHESEERYLLLLNSTAEAIYGIDLNGICTFCNPASLRLLGYAKTDDMLGKNMHALAHHSYADGSPYPMESCKIFVAIRKGEGTHVTDEVMWRQDGTSFPVEYWSYPMHKAGALVGAVITFLDVSDRMQDKQSIN